MAQLVADGVKAAGVDLDIKIFPLAYAAGQRPAYNLTLMPGLVKNHDHAARLNDSPFMGEVEKLMAEHDVKVLVHGYLAGGFVGKDKCIDTFKKAGVEIKNMTPEEFKQWQDIAKESSYKTFVEQTPMAKSCSTWL